MKKKPMIELNVSGIKCDACPYEDKTVRADTYEKWVNRPCPDCGENLLTEKDYKTVLRIQKIVRVVNRILPKRKMKDEDLSVLELKMNGTGEVEAGDIKPYKGKEK